MAGFLNLVVVVMTSPVAALSQQDMRRLHLLKAGHGAHHEESPFAIVGNGEFSNPVREGGLVICGNRFENSRRPI